MKPTAALFCTALVLGAQPVPKPAPFALERVLAMPIAVADTQVTLDKVDEVTVVAPDFFVFTAHTTVASPGAFNMGWGAFSWKAGELKTLLLDTKTFKPLYGTFPEKSNFNPERSRFIARDGLLYFTVSSGWIAATPDMHQGWTGGLYSWDGQQVRKVAAQGDTIALSGGTRSVKSANLLAVQPGGACLVYLRTDRESGIALWRNGAAEPWLLEKGPLPDGTTLKAIERLLGVAPQGDGLFALLEPAQGEPFLAAIAAGKVTKVLDAKGPDPLEPASRLYHVARADAADANAAAIWAYVYQGGRTDRRLGRLYLWDQGALRRIYGTPEQSWPAGVGDAREDAFGACWWTDRAKRQFLVLNQRRLDGATLGLSCRYFDGNTLQDVAVAGHLPNILPRAWPVPAGLAVTGFYCPTFPRGEWQPVSSLFEPRAPYRLQSGGEYVSTNQVRFPLTAIRGWDAAASRYVILLPEGFYLTK